MDMRLLVDLPAGLDYNEWLASHSKYKFSIPNILLQIYSLIVYPNFTKIMTVALYLYCIIINTQQTFFQSSDSFQQRQYSNFWVLIFHLDLSGSSEIISKPKSMFEKVVSLRYDIVIKYWFQRIITLQKMNDTLNKSIKIHKYDFFFQQWLYLIMSI